MVTASILGLEYANLIMICERHGDNPDHVIVYTRSILSNKALSGLDKLEDVGRRPHCHKRQVQESRYYDFAQIKVTAQCRI